MFLIKISSSELTEHNDVLNRPPTTFSIYSMTNGAMFYQNIISFVLHQCFVSILFKTSLYAIPNSEFKYQHFFQLQWRHNERDGVSNHQLHDYLLNRLFRCRSNKTSKTRVTGLREGNSSVTGEFITQRASNEENVSIWWRQTSSWRRYTWILSKPAEIIASSRSVTSCNGRPKLLFNYRLFRSLWHLPR